MIKYFRSPTISISDLEGDIHSESDCEGDLPGGKNQLKLGGKEQTRVVLTRGSFSACVHRQILSSPRHE